jgi:hypothetical protein
MKITSFAGSHRFTRLLVLGIFLIASSVSALAAGSPSALDAEAKGWNDLMPTADLKGWTRIAIPPTNLLGRAQWHPEAARQVLVCDGDGGHEMLRFDQKLTNCIFHVECRFIPLTGKKHYYNSGIFIRNSADGTIWHQCQLTMDGGYLFGNTPVKGQAQPFMAQAEGRCMKPAGEWNIVEVTARGKMLSVWFNGSVMSEFDECEMSAGYIALESEGFAIEFLNLKLKELP